MMEPVSSVLLHAGQEVTFVEYLFRVLVYLVGFGGVAGLTYWLAGALDPGQSRVAAVGESDEGER